MTKCKKAQVQKKVQKLIRSIRILKQNFDIRIYM